VIALLARQQPYFCFAVMLRSAASILSLLLLFAHSAPAKPKVDRRMVRALQADIGYLASDALEGRRTGSEGERKAADYLIIRYQKLKIPPYGADYRHSYSFIHGKEIGATSIAVNGQSMQMGAEVFPFAFSGSGEVSGDVLTDVQEQGAIWALPLYASADEADNPNFDAEKAAWEKAREAANTGATGVLFYDPYDAKFPPAFNPHSDFDVLSIPIAFAGYSQWQKAIANGAAAVVIRMNVHLVKPEYTSNNVAAFINNNAPLTVVLGAHYDHPGYGEDGGSLYTGKDRKICNGADDNASGTAALLQIAEWLKKTKSAHRYNYLFAHFSGEEPGLFGSESFVSEAGMDSSHIAYMLNMDMLGRLTDSTRAVMVGGIGTAPQWSIVADILHRKGFRAVIDSSGIGPSDHASFYNKGIPVLFFCTGIHSDYHKPTDDSDKINYAGEASIIHAIEGIIMAIDRGPRPHFTPTKQENKGKARFKAALGIMPDYAYPGEGVRVNGISEGRPAAKAGIMPGDVIIRIGNDVVRDMQSYTDALSHLNAGNVTEITIRRGDKELKLKVAL
jgi:hypothetical protein